MKQLEIVDQVYYKILIGIFGVLILYNLYVIINTISIKGIVSILIESGLLYLLFSKNHLSQKLIKIWTIFFLIGVQLVIILSIFVQFWAKSKLNEPDAFGLLVSNRFIFSLSLVFCGFIVLILNKEFGSVRV